MIEPYRYTCPACGGINNHSQNCLYPPKPPPEEVLAIFTAYIDLRRDCMAVEELIGRPAEAGKEALSADDLKRLDKAIMVMKVGFKMMKKVLRSQGVGGMSAWR